MISTGGVDSDFPRTVLVAGGGPQGGVARPCWDVSRGQLSVRSVLGIDVLLAARHKWQGGGRAAGQGDERGGRRTGAGAPAGPAVPAPWERERTRLRKPQAHWRCSPGHLALVWTMPG